MKEFIRNDLDLLNDIQTNIDEVIGSFAKIYGTYLKFLSNTNSQQTGGIQWAPVKEAKNVLFRIAYTIIVSSIDSMYCNKIDSFEGCKPIFLKKYNELGNVLIVPLDMDIDYSYNEESISIERLEFMVKRSLSLCGKVVTPNRIIFVPLSTGVDIKNLIFLKFHDNHDDLKKKLEQLCLDYFYPDYYYIAHYDNIIKCNNIKKVTGAIQVMSFSDFLDNVECFEKENLYQYLSDFPELINLLKKENIGQLYNRFQNLFFELFKLSSNLSSNTNYEIDLNNTCIQILNKSYNCVLIEEINENKDTMISQSIIDNANKNVNLLKKWNLYQMIITSEFLFMEYNGISNLDNTFIVSGYFKSVEYLLYKILNKFYNNIKMYKIKDDKREEITINDNLEVGRMNEIIAILIYGKHIGYDEGKLLFNKIENWKNIRNGYFHKHVLLANECEKIKIVTCELLFYIIGVLPSNEKKEGKIEITSKIFKKVNIDGIRELNF